MTKARWGTVAIGVCGVWWAFATARVGAEGLAGLDAQLNGTGRIGTYAPQGTHIATPDAGVSSKRVARSGPGDVAPQRRHR